MELLPQQAPQPAEEPSGPKVTHFTFLLTPDTGARMRDGNSHMLLSGSVIYKSSSLVYWHAFEPVVTLSFFQNPETPLWP